MTIFVKCWCIILLCSDKNMLVFYLYRQRNKKFVTILIIKIDRLFRKLWRFLWKNVWKWLHPSRTYRYRFFFYISNFIPVLNVTKHMDPTHYHPHRKAYPNMCYCLHLTRNTLLTGNTLANANHRGCQLVIMRGFYEP